jgi:fluoride exporter
VKTVLAVAVGGALGSVLRYGVTSVARYVSPDFPIGTLAVNVVGSFAMGLLAVLFAARFADQDTMRLFLLTGILGGFTTFSAFSLDALSLSQDGRMGAALVYVASSVILSLLAVIAGYAALKLFQ